MGSLDTSTSDIKEVRTEDKACLLKSFTGCRIGDAICGVRIDYHDCEMVRARTKACQDKKQVSACYTDTFKKNETIVGISTSKNEEFANGMFFTTPIK